MNKGFLEFVERYVTRKIGVEIKCCLMFFMAVCFYGGYRLIIGVQEASIMHMLEMVILAYVLGWIQSLVGSDFDEVDRLSIKDWMVVAGCSVVYTLAALFFGWFSENITAAAAFGVYMVVAYLCAFLVYKIKRAIDAKLLNDDLKKFQQREIKK